jgi:hypothetical protein
MSFQIKNSIGCCITQQESFSDMGHIRQSKVYYGGKMLVPVIEERNELQEM